MKLFKNHLPLIIAITLFGLAQTSTAQTLVGAQIDNRAGIRGLTLNPANVINPRLKSEINLFTTSAYFGNDYIGVNISDISKITTLDELSATSEINPKPDNNFVGNLDIFGPSFQMNLSPKHSIAISTRFRTFFNLNNIGGEFIDAIVDEEEETSQFEVLMQDLNGITHIWGEIGGTYGRVFLNNESIELKGAATLKYLFGAGGVTTSSATLGAVYLEASNNLTTLGQLDYGYTDGVDNGEIDFGTFNSGFGMDLGVILEIKDKRERAYGDGYMFRGGVSVLDIGGISYKGFSETSYDMNARISLDEFDDKSIGEVLEENYDGTTNVRDQNLAMPTSLQIFGDFAVTNKFYLSANVSINLRDHQEIPVSQITNNISITPRFESGWLAVYSPLSHRQYEEGLSWGLGVRLGPVIIGSGSILTNFLSKNSRSTDAYLGVQVPIYKKGKKMNTN